MHQLWSDKRGDNAQHKYDSGDEQVRLLIKPEQHADFAVVAVGNGFVQFVYNTGTQAQFHDCQHGDEVEESAFHAHIIKAQDPGKDAAGDKGAQHQNQVGRTADDNIDNRLLGSHNRGSLRVIMRNDRRV